MIKLLGVLGVALVLTLGFLLVRDPGYIPMFDANRIELVDTDAEAQCAAELFAKTRGMGEQDTATVKACTPSAKGNQEVDLTNIQPAWCSAFIGTGAWNGTTDECVDILRGRELWPNLRGSLSDTWVRQFPYPGSMIDTAMSSVRNVVRGETEREEFTDARS